MLPSSNRAPDLQTLPNDQPVTLTGTIDRIFFKSEENGFSVFVLNIGNKQEVIVRGTMATLNAGEVIEVEGTWVTHPKFGKQIQATRCTLHQPTSILGLKKYLGSGLIKGIGPAYAERLVNYFGKTVLEIIDKYPERLTEVPGIGQKRIEIITTAWQDQKEISHIMVFLQEKGISTVHATKIYKTYRNKSIEIMLENPYRLTEDIWGMGFKTADTIAQNLNIAPDSVKRCRAGILHVIAVLVQNGHLYVELDELKKATHELLALEQENSGIVKNALHDLYNSDKIKLITFQDQHFVTLSQYYFSEKGVAGLLKQLLTTPSQCAFDGEAMYTALRSHNATAAVELNEDQQRGIMSCIQNKITIITGGPGTGKTTLIKQLLHLLDQDKIVYKLAAPTGRAAKRITQGTGKGATTLHRLLEFDPAIMNFTRNEQNALALDILIVDEASMIDIFLAHAVLKALPYSAHLILIGDIDQLPSVGAGNFLHNTIASETIPTVRLTHIFRQAQDSLIVTNAHRINNNEFPITENAGSKKDFFFIKEEDPLNLPTHFQKIYRTLLPRFHISVEECMVLTPMNRGTGGTQKLNHDLQQLINPQKSAKSVAYGSYTYTIGDRVMQTRNNYDKYIFNGDIGTIEAIDTQERMLHIRFLDQSVEYDFSELDELVLAYAISIHKSQGSEYDAVIIPIFMQHFTLLQRNLLYTAITRAKKVCILIGQSKAIWMAIKNNRGTERTTFLTQFLTSDLKARS